MAKNRHPLPHLGPRYQLLEQLGSGGMGEVWRVRDPASPPEEKALKILPGDPGPRTLDLFRSEFRLLSVLRHPNLAAVWDFGELPDGRRYFTSDFVSGVSLAQALDGKPVASAVQALAALCRVLDHLHTRGVLHNDIKSSNIIVPAGGAMESLRLIDFGLAGLDPAGGGKIVGTPGYLAPERLEGTPWDARADLFSVGATLYRCLAGHLPFPGEQPSEQLGEIRRGPPPLALFRADVPAGLERILERMCAAKPTDRFRRGGEVIEALAVEGLGSFPLETPGSAESYALGAVCVGREAQIAAIAAWAAAENDERVLVLEAPAGIGKSRLAGEVRVRRQLAGDPVVVVAAPESGPFAAARTAARALPGERATADVTADGSESRDPTATAQALARDILDRAPDRTLFIFDGAEDMDPGSREVVDRLLRLSDAAGRRIKLLFAARTGSAGEAAAWIEDGIAGGRFGLLRLQPFGAPEVGVLCRTLFGADVLPEADRALLARASEGIPLRIQNMIRSLLGSGALAADAHGFRLVDPAAPARVAAEGLEAALRRIFGDATEEARSLLETMVCAGRPEDLDLLAEASGLPAAGATRAASELAATGLVRIDRAGGDVVHDAIRAMVRTLVPPGHLKRRHAALVSALRARGASSERLAAHLGQAGEFRAATPLAIEATRRRIAAGDVKGAVGIAGDALAWAEAGGSLPAELAVAAELLGDARREVADPARAVAAYDRALAAASVPDDRVRLQAKAARALERAGRGPEAGARIASAMAEPGPIASVSAATLALARAVQQTVVGRADVAAALAGEGLAALAALPPDQRPPPALRHDLEYIVALALFYANDYPGAERACRRLLHRPAGAVAPGYWVRAVIVLAAVLGDSGRAALALDWIDRSLALCRDFGLEQMEPDLLANRSQVLGLLGRHLEAESDAKRAVALARARNTPVSGPISVQAIALLDMGRAREALDVIDQAAVAAREQGRSVDVAEYSVIEAVAASRIGDRARLDDIVTRWSPVLASASSRDRIWLRVTLAIARTAREAPADGVAEMVAAARSLEQLGAMASAVRVWIEAARIAASGGPALAAEAAAAAARAGDIYETIGNRVAAAEARKLAAPPADDVRSVVARMTGVIEGLTAAGSERLWAEALHRALAAVGAPSASVLVQEAGGLRRHAGPEVTASESTRLRDAGDREARTIGDGAGETTLAAPRRALLFASGGRLRAMVVWDEPSAEQRGDPQGGGTRGGSAESGEVLRAIAAIAQVSLERIALRALLGRVRETSGRATTERDASAEGRTSSALPGSRLIEATLGDVEIRHDLPGIVGTSPAVRRVLALIDRLAASEVTVLLTGETGTGKEVFARALHDTSARASGPFVAVNCGAVPASLAESEFFGHVAGAFTGASRTGHRGTFEQASGGTLFLDEIGELPQEIQAKLLRALEEGEVRPLGASAPVRVDVRIVVATNRDLPADIAAGRFRSDLYYRLAVVELKLPPLRERPDDIVPLVRHLLAEMGDPPRTVAPDALDALRAFPWPGNVRQLRNELEGAAALRDGGVIRLEHLSAAVRGPTPRASRKPKTLHDATLVFQGQLIKDALKAAGGNQAQAARALGLLPSALHHRMKRLGLRKGTAGR